MIKLHLKLVGTFLIWILTGFICGSSAYAFKNTDLHEDKTDERICEEQVSPNIQRIKINLESKADAYHYDLQIREQKSRTKASRQIWHKYKLYQPTFKMKLLPGKYAHRYRWVDNVKNKGPWSKWQDFEVVPEPLEDSLFPISGTTLEVPPNQESLELLFTWAKIEGIKSYRFELKDFENRVLKNEVITGTWIPFQLAPNQNYYWKVTPLLETKQEGDGTLQKSMDIFAQLGWNQLSVKSNPLVKFKLNVELEGDKNYVNYQYELFKIGLTKIRTKIKVGQSQSLHFQIAIGPGEYELLTRGVTETGQFSRWSSPQTFIVPEELATYSDPTKIMVRAEILSPKSEETVVASDDRQAIIELTWKKSEDRSPYFVEVYDMNGSLLKKVKTDDTHLNVTLPHNNKFAWRVYQVQTKPAETSEKTEAIKDSTANSGSPQKDFQLFTIRKFDGLALNPGEEISEYYGWGRYIASSGEYYGINYDFNSYISQHLLMGGTEFAFGYWRPRANYGFLLAGQIDGVLIADKRFAYKGASLLTAYRRSFGANSSVRAWGGLGYREIPEILVDPITAELDFSSVGNYGPEARLEYSKGLTEKLGFQLGVSFFYSLGQGSTRGDQSPAKVDSYSISASLIYRINSTFGAMMGHMYKIDKASYNSLDRTGGVNSINQSGHYLSLALIFGSGSPEDDGAFSAESRL